MADVLFVCVRADIERAEALADMFEAAGFSVDGAPSDDADVKGASAAIILWSRSSLRSREFLTTAQRYIDAGNALIACLSDPPPVADVNGAQVFDLSAWNGDPDDALIDPLFRAVDRSVGAAAGLDIELAPRLVALADSDDDFVAAEASVAESEYFSLHGADAYAGLPVAWSAPDSQRSEPPNLSDRPARRYRAPHASSSLLRHGGAIARLMALVLIVGGGVAFAATSLAPRQTPLQPQARQEIVQASMPLDAVMEAGAPMPEFLPEPNQFAQNAEPPARLREPASAPAGAQFEPTAFTAPTPLPLWLDTVEPTLAGAPLIARAQDAAVLGSAELPDEMFKPEPIAKAPASV
jgi:hypothetical protein